MPLFYKIETLTVHSTLPSLRVNFTLGYNKTMHRKWVIRFIVIAILGAALWASTMLIAYTDRGYICENTGSRKGHREWFFGLRTNEWYHESELEIFMETNHPESLQYRWTSYRGTGHSLIPVLKSYGHGRPGLIVFPTSGMLDDYVQSLSDAQRLELYHILCSADDQRIREVIDNIYDSRP